MQRLKRRREFLAAARAASKAAPGVVVQMRKRGDEDAARVGFTVTKKLGGAVERVETSPIKSGGRTRQSDRSKSDRSKTGAVRKSGS